MGEGKPPGRAGADPGVVVSRYEQRDRDKLLEFRRDHYGADSAQADPAYVDWQFRQAPGIAEHGAPLHLAWKDGQVVGTIGTIRTSLYLKGQALPAVWAIDFAVRGDLRRSGVGEALSVASRAEGGARLVIDATPATRGIVSRAGYHSIGDVPLFVRPIDPARWLRSHGVPAGLAWLSLAALPALAALDSRALRFARREKVELLETRAFDERADVLFAALSLRYPLLCCRDRPWLEWRFQRYPQPGRYGLYWLMRNGAAAGYAVLRAGTHHGTASGMLVDHLCAPELVPALLALCLERFRAAGAVVASCLQLDPLGAGAFRAGGFFRRRSGWQFLARPQAAATASAVVDGGSWYLTAGDANVDRDRKGPLPAG